MWLSKCLVLLLFASVLAQQRCGRRGSSLGLIVGGTQTNRNEWPWLVSLFNTVSQKFFCGATIISETLVLTAAHCIKPKDSTRSLDAHEVIAYLGKYNVKLAYERGVDAFYPNEILIHPDWNVHDKKYDADLAILRSETPIRFSIKIAPACLWAEGVNEVSEGIAAGWGTSNASNLLNYEDISRHVAIKKISKEECYEKNPYFVAISSPRTFCAGGDDAGLCTGDSGGGLYVSINDVWYVNGVVSSTILTEKKHCDVNSYTVFTLISEFKTWIDNMFTKDKPTPAPSCQKSAYNRKICSSIDNLYDNDSFPRRYLKSVCTIGGRINFTEAKKKCLDAGMNLFIVRDAIDQKVFVKAATDQFLKFNSSVGWVNGERLSKGNWVSYAPDETPLFKGIAWGEGGASNSGNCLVIKKNSMSENQYFKPRNCNKTHWTHCEFYDDLM